MTTEVISSETGRYVCSGCPSTSETRKMQAETEEKARDRRNLLTERRNLLTESLERLGQNLEKRRNLPGDRHFPAFEEECKLLRELLIKEMEGIDQELERVDQELKMYPGSGGPSKTMRLSTSSHIPYGSPHCYPSERVGETSNQSGVSPSSASSSGSGRSYKFAHCGGAENVHLSPRFNPGETSEGASLRNGVLDEVANQRGIPEMRDLCSGATNSTSSISHGRFEFAGDGQARIPGRAQDMHPGTYLNRQEISNRGDAVIQIIGDDDRTSPATPDNCSRETKFLTEFNNIIIGITAQAAVALISSSSSSSPFLRFFAAATGIGFLGSFLANFILKKPKLATIAYKVGSVGAASAVIFALGSYLPKDPQWALISMVATWAMAVIIAMVVAIA